MAVDYMARGMAAGSESKIFIAVYGETTAAEVSAALTAGKAVVCEYIQDDVHCQMLLETESDSKYTFTEVGISTYNGVTSVYGYGAALNKTTNAWELISGNGTIPSTAEQITYNSGLQTHESGSVGAQLAAISSQFMKLDASIADAYLSSATYDAGDYCVYNDRLYKCINAISTAEDWNSDNWAQTNIMNELVAMIGNS